MLLGNQKYTEKKTQFITDNKQLECSCKLFSNLICFFFFFSCQLKTLDSWTLSSRALQAIRGKRTIQQYTISEQYFPYLLLFINCIYLFIISASLEFNVHINKIWYIQVINIISYIWLYGISIGLSFILIRQNLGMNIVCFLLFSIVSCSGILSSIVINTYCTTNIILLWNIIIRCLSCGILLYLSIIDILFEELNRHEFSLLKMIFFIIILCIVIGCVFI
jgi:hypothetical protein